MPDYKDLKRLLDLALLKGQIDIGFYHAKCKELDNKKRKQTTPHYSDANTLNKVTTLSK